MSLNMVSWNDYEGVDGFGVSSQEQVSELNKALTAGQEINAPGVFAPGDGFALRVESLEKTLKVVSYRMEHIKLFKTVNKLPAFNTIEEHNVLSQFGQNLDAGFVDEGDLPEEDDSTYERDYAVIKYMGTTRRVTHPMTLVKPAHENVVSLETINGTMHLLKMVERGLFYGDSSLSSLQFDGFQKLLEDNSPASNIIDLRGQTISEDVLTDACLTAQDAPNYGNITDMFCNPKVHADLIKTFFPKERHDTFQKVGDTVGLMINGFTSPAGRVQFQPDVFITDGGGASATGIGDATKRPGVPTISTGATTPADALSQFAADDAGSYWYKVVAVNRYGRSAAVAVAGAAVAVVAGDKTTFGVTPSGSTNVNWYEIYRSLKDGASGTERLILRVPNAAGSGEQTIDDYNANLPYTTCAFLFQNNLESLSLKQLAPMLRIPLSTIDASIRWMQLIYLTPVLYAPGKNVLLKNIGRAQGYVGAP